MKAWPLIWRLVTYRFWQALICVVSWLLISLSAVGLGLVARAFFDRLAGPAGGTPAVWWLVLLPLLVQSGRLLVTWLSLPTTVLQRMSVVALLSTNLFRHLLTRPGARAFVGSPGEVISRFRDDVDEVATFASMLRLLSVTGEGVTAVITLGLMLSINRYITVVAVLPLAGVVLLARTAGARLGRFRDQSRAATAGVTGLIGEIFGMVQAIQLAGAERQVTDHLRSLGEGRREAAVRDSLFTEVLRSVMVNTASLGTGLVLLLAAGSMRAGHFTVGDFALFASCVGRVTLFTGDIGELLARYRQAGVSLGRMHGLMPGTTEQALVVHAPTYLESEPPAQTEHPAPVDPGEPLEVLEVRDLTCLHPGSERGIRGVHLRIERGTLTVVTGRVGSGKSTLLKALLGLLPLEAGEIRWNGRLVTDPASHFQPPRSSYTPQVPVLFSETLRENILLGLPETADLAGATRAAILDHELGSFEQGLDTGVGPRGVKLSGGQVQRTAAARMFVRAPELLVMDDLSSALDVQTEQELWARLKARPGRTCLAASHRRAALQAADGIVVLKVGRVEATGTLDELLSTCAEFRAIWSGSEA